MVGVGCVTLAVMAVSDGFIYATMNSIRSPAFTENFCGGESSVTVSVWFIQFRRVTMAL